MVSRRGFLKLLGAAGAAIVAAPALAEAAPKLVTPAPSAPLFVPAERLDFGVPTQRLVISSDVAKAVRETEHLRASVEQAERWVAGQVPMLLLQDNYLPQYGGKLKAGAEVLVDQATAKRWMAFNVAVPSPTAPVEAQQQYVERRAFVEDERGKYFGRTPDRLAQSVTIWGLPVVTGHGDYPRHLMNDLIREQAKAEVSAASSRVREFVLPASAPTADELARMTARQRRRAYVDACEVREAKRAMSKDA